MLQLRNTITSTCVFNLRGIKVLTESHSDDRKVDDDRRRVEDIRQGMGSSSERRATALKAAKPLETMQISHPSQMLRTSFASSLLNPRAVRRRKD